MRILVIHGAIRKGNTYRISEVIRDHITRQSAVQWNEVWLKDTHLAFCASCYRCFEQGEEHCPHADAVQPLVDSIAAADGLIVTSPCFALQVPGHVKCWIDHMSYHFHRPTFFAKKGLVLSTTAGQGAKAITTYLSDILQHWGFNRVHRLPIACRSLTYHPDARARRRIVHVADGFYQDLISKKLHQPSLKQIAYFNAWRAMALMGQEKKNRDYTYWQDTGMCHVTYFPEIPIGPGKATLGKAMFWLMKRVTRTNNESAGSH